VADDRRRPAPLLPGDSSPGQDRLLRLVSDGLSGKNGVFIGTRWRLIEEPYPQGGPLCLVVQVRSKNGWVHIAVFGPDGSINGMAGGGGSALPAVYTTAARPPASASTWGTTIVVRDPGVDDVWQVCRMLSGGTYEWSTLAY
jgi:hypothetical protein